MRKLLSLSAALMFVATQAFAVSLPSPDGTTQNKRQVGGLRSDAVRVVQLVRYANQGPDAATINSGEVVVWDTTSADGVTITTTTTSADGAIAGIAATDIETADTTTSTGASGDTFGRNWGYITIYGPAVAEVGGRNAAAVGESFFTSTDSTKITAWDTENAPTDTGKLADGRPGGFFLVAPGSDNTNTLVFVHTE